MHNNWKRKSFQQTVLEQLNTSTEKINLEPYLTPHKHYFKMNHKFKHSKL